MKLILVENNQTWNIQFYVNHAVDYFGPLESAWNYFLALYLFTSTICLAMLCPGLTKEVDFGYLGVEMGAKHEFSVNWYASMTDSYTDLYVKFSFLSVPMILPSYHAVM